MSPLSYRIHNRRDMLKKKGINNIQKMWYVYTVEYYSAIFKNKIMPFAAIQMQLETIILSEVRMRKKNTVCYHLYVESKI